MHLPFITQGEQGTNLYDVLGLVDPTLNETEDGLKDQDIKAAYRNALLKHHPDKIAGQGSLPIEASHIKHDEPAYTIDQIIYAFNVLSDPRKRQAYDEQLFRQARQDSIGLRKGETTELDVIDLDDMSFDEAAGLWTKTCRCGNRKGFALSEDDLNVDGGTPLGEVLLACPDCSHHVKVLYEVAAG